MSGWVSVVGAGAWGTALSNVLVSAGNDVRLWSYESEVAQAINNKRENPYLPDCPVSSGVVASTDLAWVVQGAEVIVSVSPSQVVRKVMSNASGYIAPGAIVVSAAKGIEMGTGMLMHEVLSDVLPSQSNIKIAAISGPSFAKEVALGMPTAVSIAGYEPQVVAKLQKLFNTNYFRTYALDDVTGAEVGGALKNVIALAAGIGDGLGFGHNGRAALITRGLNEISRLGATLGAKPITFMGLSGLGDLVLTCTGELSRNRTVGIRLGKGEPLKDILASMTAVAEGVQTSEAAYLLAKKHQVEMPIVEKVYEIVHDGKSPKDAVRELMERPMRHEFDGLM